jgi:hypothetical protein
LEIRYKCLFIDVEFTARPQPKSYSSWGVADGGGRRPDTYTASSRIKTPSLIGYLDLVCDWYDNGILRINPHVWLCTM